MRNQPPLDVLAEAQRTLDSVTAETEECRAVRDQAIRDALAAGTSVPQVVAVTGLSRERVYQIKRKDQQ